MILFRMGFSFEFTLLGCPGFARVVASLFGLVRTFGLAVWLVPRVLCFCLTPIPYCVERFRGFVKAGKMP
jgi:hypothetical protein